METSKRPVSITILCFLLITLAILSMSLSLFAWNTLVLHGEVIPSRIPLPIQRARMCVSAIIVTVSAISMVKRMNWGRYLFIAWGVINCMVGFTTAPLTSVSTMPGFGLLLIASFFLFRPNADNYFRVTHWFNRDVQKSEKSVTIPGILSEQAGMIKINRKADKMYFMRKYRLYVDGKKVALINNGEQVSLSLPTGDYLVRARLDWIRSNTLRIHIEPRMYTNLEVEAKKKANVFVIAILASIILMILGGSIGGIWGASIGYTVGLASFLPFVAPLRIYQVSDETRL